MKNLLKFLKYSSKTSKSFILILIFNALFGCFITLFAVYMPKEIIGAIEAGKNLKECLIYVLVFILGNFILGIINSYLTKAIEVKSEYVSQMYHYILGEKVLSIEYSYLENPYYLDLKERALFACQNQGAIIRLVRSFATILRNLFTLISLVVILASIGPGLIIILIASIGLNGLIMFLSAKTMTKFYGMLIPVNRKFGYYAGIISDIVKAKDYRLYSANDLVLNKIDLYLGETGTRFKELYPMIARNNAAMGAVSALQSFLTYTYVTYKTIKDKLPISSFSYYVSAAIQFSAIVSEIIGSFSEIWQMLNYIKPFIELLEIPEEKESSSVEFVGEIKEIEFRNVYFTYPRQEKEILTDISFKINLHEHISIVGLNGAGKTTLIKLLCRLYHPTKGNIYINGIDIFDYEINSYNKAISCVFQDYKLFAYSIKENITCGYEKDVDLDGIIEEVGLKRKISDLPKGIETSLDKQLSDDGVSISGGENQKIAIARAIYKDSSLVILDEPTSALDPLAEADIYENFHNMVGNKTAIYISHRMSSSVFCDKVLVIDNGHISDFAPHSELMKKKNSLYYKLFNSQAENYLHE